MRSLIFAALASILVGGTAALIAAPATGQEGKGSAGSKPGQAGKPGAPAVGQPGQPGQAGGAGGAGGGVAPGFAPGFQPGQVPDPQKMQEMMIKNMARSFGLRIPPLGLKWGGMVLEPADATLLDQLNLPAGKGMVVTEVDPESAAGKAGIKKHDLIVKIDDHAVPADARELLKVVGKDKADAPVDVALLRNGKEQTIKGAKLDVAALTGGAKMPGFGGAGGIGIGLGGPGVPPVPPIPLQPPGVGPIPGVPGAAGGGVRVDVFEKGQVSVKRNDDKFDADYQKDTLHITVKGKVEKNRAVPEVITVTEGTETKKYPKVQDVPQAQRAIVQQMLQMVAGNTVRPLNLSVPALPDPQGPAGGAGLPDGK
jgi:membrane-associated protease RseP (regulator of RpoE activity)